MQAQLLFASASTIQLTFTGWSHDPIWPGNPSSGSFSVVYLFDTSVVPIWKYSNPYDIILSIHGGASPSSGRTPSPSLGATVTINGQTATIDGSWTAGLSTGQHLLYNSTEFSALVQTPEGYRVSFWFDTVTGALPSSLTTLSLEPFHFDVGLTNLSAGLGGQQHHAPGLLNLPGLSLELYPTTIDLAIVPLTDATQTAAENTKFVADLISTDVDTIFSITGGADANLFQAVMAADGSRSLQFLTAPDYETNPHSYQVQVSAFDGVNTTAKTITVNVTDVNDNGPVLTTAANQTVAENTQLVAALTSTDVDTVGTNPALFSITGGADAGLFHVVTAADGSQLLQFVTAPDYETNPHGYQVEVSAFDGLNTTTQTIPVNVTDVNDNAPVITTVATQTIPENTTLVAALISTDVDTVGTNPAMLSITGGADQALFDIAGTSLVFNTAPDYETDPHAFQVSVSAFDGVNITAKTITIDITNVPGVTINGTAGNDTINATTTNEEDTINSGAGKDTIHALGGNDFINGGSGSDTMRGGAGNDTYVVDNTGDRLFENANEGTDTVQSSVSFSLSTNVEHLTLAGASNLNGTGNALSNVITGNTGNNTLKGLAGADSLMGGHGNDKLIGGADADILTGGPGSDRFVFTALSDSTVAAPDTIMDFVHGEDVFDFSSIDANSGRRGDQAFAFGGENTSVVANGVTWFESEGNTVVQADVNGDANADLQITLAGVSHNLTVTDFFF